MWCTLVSAMRKCVAKCFDIFGFAYNYCCIICINAHCMVHDIKMHCDVTVCNT